MSDNRPPVLPTAIICAGRDYAAFKTLLDSECGSSSNDPGAKHATIADYGASFVLSRQAADDIRGNPTKPAPDDDDPEPA